MEWPPHGDSAIQLKRAFEFLNWIYTYIHTCTTYSTNLEMIEPLVEE
jgi:hypothetical protein